MAKTPAAIRATAKWEANNYDKVLLRLPRGTKDRITATGATVNGFIKRAVLQALDSQPTAQPDDTNDTTPGE